MKRTHVCQESKICKFCFLPKHQNHQCPLKFEKMPQFLIRLCFFTFIYDKEENPILALFYREEEQRGLFKQYIFCDPQFKVNGDFLQEKTLDANYLNNMWPLEKDFKCNFKLSKSSFRDLV